MKQYFKNLNYILEHKRNVYIEGRKLGVGRIQLLKRDLSKLTSNEFTQYARSFFGAKKSDKIDSDMNLAWLNHKHKNKHHWQYWLDIKNKEIVPLEMPSKYFLEMLADWNAMSRKFHPDIDRHDATYRWFSEQTDIILHPNNLSWLEYYFNTGMIN